VVPGPERTLILCMSRSTLTQNFKIGNVCFVRDAVAVGLVGDTVKVGEAVGVNVAVAGSGVLVAVDVAVAGIVGVLIETTGGGVEKDFQANTNKRRRPITM